MKHLFIGGTTNSGTTVFKEIFRTSPNTVVAKREIQWRWKRSPTPSALGVKRVWSEKAELFQSEYCYDKDEVVKSFYKECPPDGEKVLVEKTPAHLLRSHILDKWFPDSVFMFTIRHPYAVCEGIRRREPSVSILRAARHWDYCARYLVQLVQDEMTGIQCAAIKYEALCDDPDSVLHFVLQKIPEVQGLRYDLVLNTPSAHKKKQKLTNYNQEHFTRLSLGDKEVIQKNVQSDILDFWGYRWE